MNTRKSRATYSHNYKIGDWIEVAAGYGYIEGHAKIIETTAKTYTYALAAIHGQRVTNFHYAKRMFNNVTGSSYDSQDWDFSIPFDGNECHFTFDSQEITKRAAQNNPKKVVPSYRSVRHARD